MQTVRAIVGYQLNGLPIQSELGVTDTVGIAPYGSAEVAGDVLVVSDIVERQHHVTLCPLTVGHHHGDDATSEVGDAHLHAVLVGQGEEFRFFTFDSGFKLSRIQSALCQHWRGIFLFLLGAGSQHQRGPTNLELYCHQFLG